MIGTSGAGIILVFFLLNQTNVLKNTSKLYDFGNLVGSLILMYYAYILWSIPFMILNGVWALYSLKDFIFDFVKKK